MMYKTDNSYTYVATCLFGLEGLLGEELDALGMRRLKTIDGRVYFSGGPEAIALCNINLRFAERVFILVGSFKATTFDELFEGTKALCWERYIGKKDKFPVKGHSIKSALFSIPDCQSIVKKAVVDRLSSKYSQSWFEETGVLYQIEFFILQNEVSLMIDTSGVALHKRGYRPAALAAPLRETLAAALVKLARPREDVLLWDPMCGSGTISIEAAMMMANIAPGVSRHFSSEEFSFIDKKTFDDARARARDLVRSTDFETFASDIDPSAVQLTRENCKRAGVSHIVKSFETDALKITTQGRRGTIVCNPPYGERLFTKEEAEELYRKMGAHFKTLENWQIYVITSSDTFERLYGRRADKVRKLYNGMIKCNYYQFFKKK